MTNETRVVRMWLLNDETLYNHACRIVRLGGSQHEAAQALKSEIYGLMPDVPGMWADLLREALREVNWNEICEDLQNDEEDDA